MFLKSINTESGGIVFLQKTLRDQSGISSLIRIDNDALVVFSKKEEKYIVIKNCFRKLLAAGNR